MERETNLVRAEFVTSDSDDVQTAQACGKKSIHAVNILVTSAQSRLPQLALRKR
jgi:hypothetical protein